jgi:hypothetical protein
MTDPDKKVRRTPCDKAKAAQERQVHEPSTASVKKSNAKRYRAGKLPPWMYT